MSTPKTIATIAFRLVFENFGWKLLSLGLAALVWIAIYREPEMAAVIAAPVQFKNSPTDLEIASEIVETVDLETRGPAGLLRDLSEKRVAVVLDFTNVREPGERTFTISRQNTNLPRGVELVRVIPSQLRFHFERRTVRMVPVVVKYAGNPRGGLRIISAVADPAELPITGPESRVSSVASVPTDTIDVSGLKEDKNMRVSAYLPNAQLRFQGSPEVTVKISIGK